MKNLSVRTKITLWFSVLIVIITLMMFVLMLVISDSVMHTDVKETLRNVVETNAQEIEYIDDISTQEIEKGDHYIEHNGTYLEIDDDFLNESGGVYTALYDAHGNLLYGENIINAKIERSGEIQKVKYNKEKYYTLSKALTGNNLDGLTLLGAVNEDANKTVLTRIINFYLIALPLFAVIAVVGGYLLAGRVLYPIKKITASAEGITDGNDLSMRLVPESTDELGALTDTFNKMLSRLERSFEEEKQFTSDISHELRTPAATILAQCELTLEKDRSVQEYKNALSLINRQSVRMKNIVEDMLRYSRLERLEKLPDAKEVDLSSLFTQVAQEQMARSERSIKISCDIDDNISIVGNSDLLVMLINNLISNAYKYGKDGGNILLSLKQNDKEVMLSVKDDGIGIGESDKDKIFCRFYQADKARTANDSRYSIGLGLSTVSAIARLHGGRVDVESELGKGSTFTFVIGKK